VALLAKHTVPPLPIEVQSELAAIVASADRDLAGKSYSDSNLKTS
jgi:hypothetical protein